MIEQMTLDGGGIAYEKAGKLPRLTDHQRAVLQVIGRFGVATPGSISVAIHQIDGETCRGITALDQERPCCDDARDRAYEVCKQLTKRKILKSKGRGRWVLAEGGG